MPVGCESPVQVEDHSAQPIVARISAPPKPSFLLLSQHLGIAAKCLGTTACARLYGVAHEHMQMRFKITLYLQSRSAHARSSLVGLRTCISAVCMCTRRIENYILAADNLQL
jgi:hypothetical protein